MWCSEKYGLYYCRTTNKARGTQRPSTCCFESISPTPPTSEIFIPNPVQQKGLQQRKAMKVQKPYELVWVIFYLRTPHSQHESQDSGDRSGGGQCSGCHVETGVGAAIAIAPNGCSL